MLVKPSSRARRATASASSGFWMPAAHHGVDVDRRTRACSASQRSFGSSRRRLFIETSSGSTLSMLICR